MNKRICVALISYIASVTIAEIVIMHHVAAHPNSPPYAGMCIHAVLLLFLILYSSLEQEKKFSNLFKVLTLAPLIRLLANSTPLVVIQDIYQFFMISIVLVLAVLLLIENLGIRKEVVGLKWGDPRVQLTIALTGKRSFLIESPTSFRVHLISIASVLPRYCTTAHHNKAENCISCRV